MTAGPNNPGNERLEWGIALHGGAGTISRNAGPERERLYREALADALEIGRRILDEGGTSLDAVETVVRTLEDSPLFNAGRGSAYAADGTHQMDASIMDGSNRAAGAVGAVRHVRNPIALARHIMEQTPHVLVVGAGAEELAESAGIALEAPEYFHTEMRYERWRRAQERERISIEAGEIERGTVGAVALDRHGNLAAATSTGGLTNKMTGRVGDTPIIGAGVWADNATCAISCTGHGEEFMRHVTAHRIATLVEFAGHDIESAMHEVLVENMEPGIGGVIGIDSNGRIALVFSTRGMYRGAADSTGRFDVAIWDD